jgi:hypothetical protein
MSKDETPPHLHQAYNRMIERAREIMQTSGERLDNAVDDARETAHELGELTRDEADLLAQYVKRDLQDLGDYLRDPDGDLRTWFHMDTELIESPIRDLLFSVADQTSVQLAEFARNAGRPAIWRTGEMTAPGVLECTKCTEQLRFTKAGRIPPCPSCHNTEFRRLREKSSAE